MRIFARLAPLLLSVLVMPAPSFSQETAVLATLPEGVVVDAAPIPTLRAGTRLGFVQLDPARREIGHGAVADIREGRALVRLSGGSAGKQGDLAVVCPDPASDPYGELRGMLAQFRSQATQPGAQPATQVEPTVNQLQLALDTRDALVRSGACDTVEYDRQIAALTSDLQGLSATIQPGSATDPTFGGPPPASGEKSGFESAVDALGKIVGLLQSMGLKFGQPSGGSGPAPMPDGFSSWPSSTGGDAAGIPPSVPPSTPPSWPTPPSTPPSPTSQVATVQGRVLGAGVGLAGVEITAAEWNQSARSAPDGTYYLQGPGGQVTLVAKATGFDHAILVTIAAPGVAVTRNLILKKTGSAGKSDLTPISGRLQFAKPAAAAPQPSAKSATPWWTVQKVAVARPAAALPWYAVPKVAPSPAPPPSKMTPIAGSSMKPTPAPMVAKVPLAKVSGRVMDERGQPIAGARVSAAAAGSVMTNNQGWFGLDKLGVGKQEIFVSAAGFRTESRRVTLEPGETEVVNFSLRRVHMAPGKPIPPKTAPKPDLFRKSGLSVQPRQ